MLCSLPHSRSTIGPWQACITGDCVIDRRKKKEIFSPVFPLVLVLAIFFKLSAPNHHSQHRQKLGGLALHLGSQPLTHTTWWSNRYLHSIPMHVCDLKKESEHFGTSPKRPYIRPSQISRDHYRWNIQNKNVTYSSERELLLTSILNKNVTYSSERHAKSPDFHVIPKTHL
eukprot:g81986.t1